MAEPDHITLETGEKIVLEDGTDHLILESSDTAEHTATVRSLLTMGVGQ